MHWRIITLSGLTHLLNHLRHPVPWIASCRLADCLLLLKSDFFALLPH